MTTTLQKSEAESRPDKKNAVTITGTWDGVRHWLNAAKMFEQGKLFSQVMTGFELLALRKANNIQHGGDRASSQNGNLKDDWETILQKEAGLAQSTAYRYMDMAKAAAPRLKKLPALKNFDPFTTSMAMLAEPQREAMATAVKKLTDGKSQADFFEELYKTGGKSPGREAGCDNSKTKLSLSEQAELRKGQALKDWQAIWKSLTAYQDKFLLLTDADITAQIATLEQHLTARRAWLKQPLNRRDPKAVTELFNGGAK